MKIKIQVYYHTDETRKFDDLEIDYTIADCEKRWMTFFNINAIGKFVDTDKQEYGKIFCNGDSFITVVSYQYLEDFIRNNCSEDGHVLTAGEKWIKH